MATTGSAEEPNVATVDVDHLLVEIKLLKERVAALEEENENLRQSAAITHERELDLADSELSAMARLYAQRRQVDEELRRAMADKIDHDEKVQQELARALEAEVGMHREDLVRFATLWEEGKAAQHRQLESAIAANAAQPSAEMSASMDASRLTDISAACQNCAQLQEQLRKQSEELKLVNEKYQDALTTIQRLEQELGELKQPLIPSARASSASGKLN